MKKGILYHIVYMVILLKLEFLLKLAKIAYLGGAIFCKENQDILASKSDF